MLGIKAPFLTTLLPLAVLWLASSTGAGTGGAAGDHGWTRASDNRALEQFLRTWTEEFEGGGGRWVFEVDGVEVMLLSDEAHNRMRIISPVTEAEGLPRTQLVTLLEADFDRALDAKYAIWKGVLWASYVHPLDVLTQQEFDGGLQQVVRLRANYGTTYSSTDMVFSGGEAPQGKQDDRAP